MATRKIKTPGFASSDFVKQQRREYALYVLASRAMPSLADGLAAAGRRNLWTARNGKQFKTESLSGITMAIHPHGESSDAINTLAAFYGNNIPLFKGEGAFGTRLDRKAYGAPRYTKVAVSKFTQDVVFCDLEIVPMVDNYDHTEKEPLHFLPLVPIVLLNPFDGIAVGYASHILPRSLEDLIVAQIAHLKGAKNISDPVPKFTPLNNEAAKSVPTPKGQTYYFYGKFERINKSEFRITDLPFGVNHEDVIKNLDKMWDEGTIISYVDNSAKTVDILVKMPRGSLDTYTDDQIFTSFQLIGKMSEILSVLDFTGKYVLNLTPAEAIKMFTDWRLGWYKVRYQRLYDIQKRELERYYDIRTAIKNNVGGVAKKIQSRAELKDFLSKIDIVHVDYIADLPVYRFTQDEYNKNELKIAEGEKQLKAYEDLLSNPESRKKIYIDELRDVLTKYNKGSY